MRLRLEGGALFEGSRLIAEASSDRLVLATSDYRRDERFLSKAARRLGVSWIGCRSVAELVQLIGASSGVVSDRYHPAICAAALGKPAQVLSNREPHKMHGLKNLLADHTLEELQELARTGLSTLRDALRSAVYLSRDNPLGRPIRLLSLYPSFWPRQGGGQMVLAAIAQGLSPQISNTVLTRRFHDTPAREEYDYLSVHRFRNPAPDVGKTTRRALATCRSGRSASSPASMSSARWVRCAGCGASRISFTCTSRCRWA